MNAKLVLVIGVPGTGKSTLAEVLRHRLTTDKHLCVHRETDEYFVNASTGEYEFDPSKLGEYHELCLRMTESDLASGVNVIVSNTNLTKWERAKYFNIARRHNVTVVVIIMRKQYGNIHNIPSEKIQQMEQKWEEVSSDEIIGLRVQFMDPSSFNHQ